LGEEIVEVGGRQVVSVSVHEVEGRGCAISNAQTIRVVAVYKGVQIVVQIIVADRLREALSGALGAEGVPSQTALAGAERPNQVVIHPTRGRFLKVVPASLRRYIPEAASRVVGNVGSHYLVVGGAGLGRPAQCSGIRRVLEGNGLGDLVHDAESEIPRTLVIGTVVDFRRTGVGATVPVIAIDVAGMSVTVRVQEVRGAGIAVVVYAVAADLGISGIASGVAIIAIPLALRVAIHVVIGILRRRLRPIGIVAIVVQSVTDLRCARIDV